MMAHMGQKVAMADFFETGALGIHFMAWGTSSKLWATPRTACGTAGTHGGVSGATSASRGPKMATLSWTTTLPRAWLASPTGLLTREFEFLTFRDFLVQPLNLQNYHEFEA